MDWNLIITKIFEVMKRILGYMNSLSENNFMLVNYGALSGENVPQGVKTWFFMSFVILIFLAILASDSFRWKEPIEEIKEWPYKISIIKVLIFSATIFSIHTFYKMLIISVL